MSCAMPCPDIKDDIKTASSLPPGENLLIDSILEDLMVSSKPGTFGLLMARCLCAMLCLFLVVSRLVSSM